MEIDYPFDTARTVAFSGFRPEKLIASAPDYDLSEIQHVLFERLRYAIRYFHSGGYNTYLTGMADGFDLLAGEAVLSLQQELRDLRLACIVPFATHGNSGSATYKARYKSVKLCASYYYAIGEKPYKSEFIRRNDVLLAHSSALICYYDGVQNGGTKYTVSMAQKLGRTILNLYLGRSGAAYTHNIDEQITRTLRNLLQPNK
nr:MAG TPA: Protein of unknown function (DUF1273) [Caudoviricetes sp.]